MFAVEISTAVITGKLLIQPLEQAEYNMELGLFISKIISFGMVVIIKNFLSAKEKDSPPILICIASLFIPICTIAVEILFVAASGVNQLSILVTMILLLFVNATAFILFDALATSYHQLLLDQIAKKERQYFMNQCTLMQQTAEDTRKIRHDMVNHYIVLQELIESEDTYNAKEYLSNLIRCEKRLRCIYSQTGNIVIDSIINYKLSTVKDEITDMDIDITVPTELSMPMTDLSIILSNLLDNALTALKNTTTRKSLKIQIVFQKDMLAITISNTFNGETHYLNGELVTSKSDNVKHGFGLKNVQSIADKYDGLVNIKHDSTLFTVDLLLYLNSVKDRCE